MTRPRPIAWCAFALAVLLGSVPSVAQDAGGSPPQTSTTASGGGAAPATAATAQDPGPIVAALSPIIGDVQIMGAWKDGSRQGVWRTVMSTLR